MRSWFFVCSFLMVAPVATSARAETPESVRRGPVGADSGLFPYRYDGGSVGYVDVLTLTSGRQRIGKLMEWADQVLLYDRAGGVEAFDVDEVREMEFRRFPRHQARPDLPDLTVAYIERLPRDAHWHGKVYLEEGLPALSESAAKAGGMPAPGTEVTFRIHVLNAGSAMSSAARVVVTIDDREIAQREIGSLQPGARESVEAAWTWADGPHRVRVQIETPEAQAEIARWNNVREEPVDAQPVAVVVDRKRYEAFTRSPNLCGSFCFEDWVHYQVCAMNGLMRASVYPTAPEGARERLRVDRILVIDDPLADDVRPRWEAALRRDGKADGLAEYAARMVFGPPGADEAINYSALRVDWPRLKRLGVDLGLVDLALTDTRIEQCLAVDRKQNYVMCRHVFPWPKTLMYAPGGFRLSEPGVSYLNRAIGRPRGFGGSFLYQVPEAVWMEVRSVGGHPVSGLEVNVYQLKSEGELAGYICGAGASEPLYTTQTDENGRVHLINQPAPELTTPHGYALRPNAFGVIAPAGSNGLLLVQLRSDDHEEHHFVRLFDAQVAYLHGDTKEYVHRVKAHFADPGALPAPIYTTVDFEEKADADGEGWPPEEWPPAPVRWKWPLGVENLDVAEFRLYRRNGFAGNDVAPWKLARIVTRAGDLWRVPELQAELAYFQTEGADPRRKLDTTIATATVDRFGRESTLSAPTFLVYDREVVKFAIDNDYNVAYMTLRGDGQCQMLHWDVEAGTQPYSVRTRNFPGYEPGFAGVAIGVDHRLLVTDPDNHVLAFYDRGNLDALVPERLWWPGFASDEPGEFNLPSDVAVDSTGNLYVADTGNDRVHILDSRGSFQGLLDEGFAFDGPHALGFANGHLCVTDKQGVRVRVYDASLWQPQFKLELPAQIEAGRALVGRTGDVFVRARRSVVEPLAILHYGVSDKEATLVGTGTEGGMGSLDQPRGLYLYNGGDADYIYCANRFPFEVRWFKIPTPGQNKLPGL